MLNMPRFPGKVFSEEDNDLAHANRLGLINRMEAQFAQHPGSAPNGTGETGLNPNDAQGWSSMLNDQQDYLNAVNAEEGKGPYNVRLGGDQRPNPYRPTPLLPPSLSGLRNAAAPQAVRYPLAKPRK